MFDRDAARRRCDEIDRQTLFDLNIMDVRRLQDDLGAALAEIERLEAENARLTSQRDEAREYAEKLYAEFGDRKVHCVYCGHTYEDGTPQSQDDRLTAHIKVCEKHPLRKAEAEIARLRERVAELEG